MAQSTPNLEMLNIMKKFLNTVWNIQKPSSYLESVYSAISDPKKFQVFRRERQYAGIVENVLEEEGRSILNCLPDEYIQLLRSTQEADKIGSPYTYDYSGLIASPTTIRYAKIVEEIDGLFNGLNSVRSIAEIGVGYGGQARLICQFMEQTGKRLGTYTLIDLPDVLNLAKRYLENFNFGNAFEYKSKSELSSGVDGYKYDLAISNYAFSEFSRAMQDEYINKVFLKARSGFILMNNGKTDKDGKHLCNEFGNHDCILDVELLKIIPKSRIVGSSFLSSKGVYLIAFGS